MPETKPIDPSLVAKIVRGYVANNSNLPATELPNLIAAVHLALAGLEKSIDPPVPEPAVAIKRSYGRKYVACLECGWRGQMLRRHLTTAHGLSRDDYRARWSLKDSHPLTAPSYVERRSTLAKELGLGRGRQQPRGAAEAAAAVQSAAPAEAPLDPAFLASLSHPMRRRGRRRTAPTPAG